MDPHTVSKNSFVVPPPTIIKAEHVPADKYMVGKKARKFPSFVPENILFVIYYYELIIHLLIGFCISIGNRCTGNTKN